MAARLIDGRAAALELRSRIAQEVESFRAATGRAPGLATVLVGEDPASAIYVRSKGKATREAGMESAAHHLSAEVSETELLALGGEPVTCDEAALSAGGVGNTYHTSRDQVLQVLKGGLSEKFNFAVKNTENNAVRAFYGLPDAGPYDSAAGRAATLTPRRDVDLFVWPQRLSSNEAQQKFFAEHQGDPGAFDRARIRVGAVAASAAGEVRVVLDAATGY